MATTETALKVNQGNLVKNLRFSFTDSCTVIAELMQNARRAGATQVEIDFAPETKTLVVRDDGCGIDCYQTLFTIAESGWDAEVVEQEHPFGLGFLSALFACGHLEVESKGGRIFTPTEDILSFKPVAVTPVVRCPAEARFKDDVCGCGSANVQGPDGEGVYDCGDCGIFFTAESIGNRCWGGVTAIRLVGFKPDAGQVALRVAELAKGFPIPVIFNGQALQRPWALDSGKEFIDTEIGKVCLRGFGPGEDWTRPVYELQICLQGLPVYRTQGHWRADSTVNIVHLDSRQFHARLPDRDKLIDAEEAVMRVRGVVIQAVKQKIRALKEGLPPAAFAEGYETLLQWGCLDLLNDVPVIPGGVLAHIQHYPIMEGSSPVNLDRAGPVAREDVEGGKVGVAELEEFDGMGAPAWMYAWHKGMLVYDNPLDGGHWLFRHLVDFNAQPVRVEIVGETHRAHFDGQWVCGDAAFCEKYRLVFGDDSVDIGGDSIYLEDGGLFVVPRGDASGCVVSQANSYFDQHDNFNESVKDEDQWSFEKFVVANTSANPAKALQRLLPSFSGCPKVFGRRFMLELDGDGKVRSVTEEDGEKPLPELRWLSVEAVCGLLRDCGYDEEFIAESVAIMQRQTQANAGADADPQAQTGTNAGIGTGECPANASAEGEAP